MRILVIGGVAAGMSAASQARRRRPDAEIVVLEKGAHVSYGACGMPYNLADPARRMDDLVVISAEKFREERRIDVRTGVEALGIDTLARVVRTRGGDLAYDALVIATGALAVRPRVPGVDLPGVFTLRDLADGESIKRFVAEARPKRAVIVGAGYIGLEMAEALRALGLEVSLLEREPQVLPGYEPAIVEAAAAALRRAGVQVETGAAVEAIEPGLSVRTARGARPADLVLLAIGVRPNVALAKEAGIALGESGAIAVDDGQRTSAPGVFAAGDCAEARHVVAGRPAWVPLGTTANKQGKVAGANAAGADERFGGIAGTAGFKLFDVEVGRTGLGLAEAKRLGFDAVAAVSRHRSRGHAYPGSKEIATVVIADRATRRLLGAQMAGGDVVAKRIDTFATALHAGFTVDQVEQLDLAYAPPFAPVYDPVLIAASVAVKALG